MNYGYPNYQPYVPMGTSNYVQSYQPYNNQYNSMMNSQSVSTDLGEPFIQLCDSVDYIKSQNVRLDGKPSYYALTDNTEIYCKRLNPQTGASILARYTLAMDDMTETKDTTNDISNIIIKLQSDISEIKEMVMDSITKPTPQKGGGK